MTTLALPSSTRRFSFFRGFVSVLSKLIAGARDGHAMARRYEALSRLSDAQLAARGMRREDIPQIAARSVG